MACKLHDHADWQRRHVANNLLLTTVRQPRRVAVAKETKTAQELAEMIMAEINVGGTSIKVHPDPNLGWRAKLVVGPQNPQALQSAADGIANRLRQKYDLKK
jgi:hypothetical protein